jgi:hypothetical protein
MKNITTLVKHFDFFNVFLSSKGSQNFSPLACMAILGGWVPDRLQ